MGARPRRLAGEDPDAVGGRNRGRERRQAPLVEDLERVSDRFLDREKRGAERSLRKADPLARPRQLAGEPAADLVLEIPEALEAELVGESDDGRRAGPDPPREVGNGAEREQGGVRGHRLGDAAFGRREPIIDGRDQVLDGHLVSPWSHVDGLLHCFDPIVR